MNVSMETPPEVESTSTEYDRTTTSLSTLDVTELNATPIPSADSQPEPVEPVIELSVEEPEPYPVPPLTFTLVKQASKRRGDKLIDSLGFSYNVQGRKPNATYWQCTIRPKGNRCSATVVERNGIFIPGQADHNHAPQTGGLTAARTVSAVNSTAMADVSTFVDEVLQEELEVVPAPCSALPEHDNTVECCFQEPEPTPISTAYVPLTFYLVEGGSKRRRNQLIDSMGFSYNVKNRRAFATYWQCTVRPKGNQCKATVKERNGFFTAGKAPHNHGTLSGTLTAARIVSAIKSKSVSNVFKPATAIVNEVLQQELPIASLCPALPKPDLIARAARRLRQKMRSEDLNDLHFSLDEHAIPQGFFQSEVKVKDRRHLIFATDQQLSQLATAKSWYIDRTDKLIGHPFQQVLSINAFVRLGERAKQVSFAFILMSGRKKSDYKKILRTIIQLLPGDWLHVQQVTVDFEQALWEALRSVVPHVRLQGCAFHWTQAVWRKVQALGLQDACSKDDSTHKYIRKLLALPLLPYREIAPQFQRLKLQATTEPLQELINYIEDTWITSIVFPIKNWSVYHQPVRTSEDIEGWQKSVNRQTSRKSQLSFYMLVQMLHREAELAVKNMRLVSNKKLVRIQRWKYGQLQSRIHQYWTEYDDREKTVAKLLKVCSKLYGPLQAWS